LKRGIPPIKLPREPLNDQGLTKGFPMMRQPRIIQRFAASVLLAAFFFPSPTVSAQKSDASRKNV
jgi:hypothetical protein